VSIPFPSFHHVKAAQGWLELGNYEEAISDLGKVDDKLHDHPDVLKVLWETFPHYPEGINQWCEQGSSKEALRALKSIKPELSKHSNLLTVQMDIYGYFGEWENMFKASCSLVEIAPERLDGWTNRSLALDLMGCTQEAYDLMKAARYKFEGDPLENARILFDIARYACALGNRDDASMYLSDCKDLAGDEMVWNSCLCDDYLSEYCDCSQ